MAVFLDEYDQHMRAIDGNDLDLILGQGGLKSFEFLDKAFGLSFLDRVSILES